MLLCHNEPEIFSLIEYVKKHKKSDDKIAVLYDPSTEEYTKKLKQASVKLIIHKLNHSYADHRNYVLQFIKTNWIFMMDADETLTELLIDNVHTIIENMRVAEVIGLFRRNIFKGATAWDCLRYGWDIKDGAIQWAKGDVQYRLFRTNKGLKFVGDVHEMLDIMNGKYKVMLAPKDHQLAIIHNKTIEQQRACNDRYNQKYTPEQNKAGGSTDNFAIIKEQI